MIRVVAKFSLKEGNFDKAIDIARKLISLTRKEEGCVHYDLVQSSENPNLIVILEAWENQEVLNVHSNSQHFNDLVPKLADLCTEAPIVDSFVQII